MEKGSLSSICSNGNDFPKPRQVEQYSKVSLVEMICMNRGVESKPSVVLFIIGARIMFFNLFRVVVTPSSGVSNSFNDQNE